MGQADVSGRWLLWHTSCLTYSLYEPQTEHLQPMESKPEKQLMYAKHSKQRGTSARCSLGERERGTWAIWANGQTIMPKGRAQSSFILAASNCPG